MTYHAIAAMSLNRVIGNQGKIPWHIPDDFRWFKHITMGGTLIMGRVTFESIGKELPGRTTQVLSRDEKKSINSKIYGGVSALHDTPARFPQPWWICGGAEIYERFLPRSQSLYLTVVKQDYLGDAFFPEFENHFRLNRILHENELFRVEYWLNQNVSDPLKYPPKEWPFAN
jgi:dihydrofolate reductase